MTQNKGWRERVTDTLNWGRSRGVKTLVSALPNLCTYMHLLSPPTPPRWWVPWRSFPPLLSSHQKPICLCGLRGRPFSDRKPQRRNNGQLTHLWGWGGSMMVCKLFKRPIYFQVSMLLGRGQKRMKSWQYAWAQSKALFSEIKMQRCSSWWLKAKNNT